MNQQQRNLWGAGVLLTCAVVLNSATSNPVVAETIIQTGTFSDISDGTTFFSPGILPTGFFFAEEIVAGIDKFDPSLGTLTSVIVTADYDVSFDFIVIADDVLDDSLPHSVDVDADFLSGFIGYSPGGGGTTFTLASADFSPFVSCLGGEFESPCSFGDGDFAAVSDFSSVSTLGDFDPSDFVGVGAVTALSAIIAIPDDALFILDNVGSASADLSADMVYLDLTVEYEYTSIPEPSALAIATVSLLAVGISRRKRI